MYLQMSSSVAFAKKIFTKILHSLLKSVNYDMVRIKSKSFDFENLINIV